MTEEKPQRLYVTLEENYEMVMSDDCTRRPRIYPPNAYDWSDYGYDFTQELKMIDDKIRAAIKVECDRQHVGEDRQEMLYDMYVVFRSSRHDQNHRLTEHMIEWVAGKIEPDNGGQFRTTPVTFNGTLGGVAPDSIPRAMEGWIEWFNTMLRNKEYLSDIGIKLVIKEFLDIHPFTDGNGRTAWLLRVWMLNQWDDPQPLPDYFGEA